MSVKEYNNIKLDKDIYLLLLFNSIIIQSFCTFQRMSSSSTPIDNRTAGSCAT
jgi:hypothetical protein